MAYVLGFTPGDLKGRMDQYDYEMPTEEVFVEVEGRLRSIKNVEIIDGQIVMTLY